MDWHNGILFFSPEMALHVYPSLLVYTHMKDVASEQSDTDWK